MAQTALNMTAMNDALKQLYDGQALVEMSYKAQPFWALLEKKENFFGTNKPLPVMFSPSAGVSSLFVNAQANEAAPQIKQFQLTRAKKYGIAQLDRETMMASSNDIGAFMAAAKINVESTMRGVTNMMCSDLFRSGTGTVGKISTITTGVIVLTIPQDVVNFEINQAIRTSTSDGSGQRTAVGYVIAVDRTAGNVTVSATLGGSAGTPTSWATTDFLLHDGDLNATFTGLGGWLPNTAPGSTTFFNVDRSVDTVRLGGVRYDGSTGPSIEEALIDTASLLQREGGMPDYCFMGPASFAALTKALGTRIVYNKVQVAEFAFKGISLLTPAGDITVVQDRNCPAKQAYMLTMDTWAFCSLGAAPEIQKDLVTGDMLRVSNADAGELRISVYGNLECNAPGHNAAILLGA